MGFINQRQLIILWVGLGLFISAFIWDGLFSGDRNLTRYKNTLEQYLHANEFKADMILADNGFVQRRVANVMAGSGFKQDLLKLDSLKLLPFNINIFKNDSLIFWSNNDVLPSYKDFSDTTKNKINAKLVNIKPSFYELRWTTYYLNNSRIVVSALIPIKKNYTSFEGQYLENHFPASRLIPADLAISDAKQKANLNTKEGIPLCYINNAELDADAVHDFGMTILLILGFFLIGIFGDRIAKQMLKQYPSPVIGTLFFFCIMALMRLCILWIQKSEILPYLDLQFSDFNNAIFVKSLSELVIDTGFLFWFSIFFNTNFRLPDHKGQPFWTRWVLALTFYSAIVLQLVLCIGVFNDLVTNWNNLLAFDNLSDFNFRSIVALLGVGMILLSVFLISHRLIYTVNELNLSHWSHFIAIDIAVGLGILMTESYQLNLPTLVIVFFIFCYIIVFQQFIRHKYPGLMWLVQWILVFSAIQAFFISRFNVQKDLKIIKDFAVNLARERDSVAERRIKHLNNSITHDASIQVMSVFPVKFEVDPQRVKEKIESHFFDDEYLSNHYSFRFFSFYRNGEALIQSDSFDIHTLKKKYDKSISLDKSNTNCRFWTNNKGDYAYLAIAEVPVMPQNPIYVAMELKRHDKLSSRVFTELFVDRHYKSLPRLNDYSYAIYKGGISTEQNQSGKYDRYIKNSETPPPGKFIHVDKGGRDEITYQNSDGVVVRIGKARAVSSQGYILLMYILLMLCSLMFILAFANHFLRFLPDVLKLDFSFSFNSSLRNRILFPSIGFVLLSYIAIFFFTVRFFKNLGDKYYNIDLETKSNTVVSNAVSELNELYKFNVMSPQTIRQVLSKYAETHQNALHFYDTNGSLYSTTEENIFDKGIISKKMNPTAYLTLRSGADRMYRGDEQIGKFHFRTAYYSIQDTTNQLLGFLELPYYSRDRKVRTDTSEIWTYNATVLTLLFLFGICVIYYLTAHNMEPIQHIAERLRKLSLGNKTKNELITWDKKDEISALIDAYNNKVIELEDTYSRLSEAEREGAWRDMAKQVAHEIRNPLTPMKLIVQHLEMIRRQRPDNIEEYLIRSNKVLLDQIDNLEKIVSEFANFAKMPQKATNEKFVINHLVSSVANLFSQVEEDKVINFTLNVPDELYTVYADRSLLTGALNNLVKNAIQSIPNDREGRIVVSLFKRNDTAIIRISDNGTGIPKDIQDKIFSPNFTTKQYGSGIGLLITKNIIQSVNGKIYFETVENEGTDFFVELDIQSTELPINSENPNKIQSSHDSEPKTEKRNGAESTENNIYNHRNGEDNRQMPPPSVY